MFACLYVPPSPVRRVVPAAASGTDDARLVDIARMVSPRIDARSGNQVVLDVQGLERLVGDARAIGERLRREASDRGITPVHVAIAGTRTAAMLLAAARAGVTVVAPGGEADALAPLPLRTLAALADVIEDRRQKAEDRRRNSEARRPNGGRGFSPGGHVEAKASTSISDPPPQGGTPNPESRVPSPDCLAVLARWGLHTLGELAALPPVELSERLGQDGIRWQRLARGEDTGPLVPAKEEEPFESSLELEWPVEDLEPLSFVLSRLLDPLCKRLEHRDRSAAALHLRLRLVTRALHLRSLQLPAPMRDPKVLRTLMLLDLEAHPAPAGIDAVTVAIDPTPGRIVQESLLTRALPAPELISTLVARLQALMGEGRCGSPATVDSYRPGAFTMTPFVVHQNEGRSQKSEGRSQKPEEVVRSQYSVASRRSPEPRELAPSAKSLAPGLAPSLRRFRIPIPAHVLIDNGRPLSVRTDRQALSGGHVRTAAGPWRTSGEWWKTAAVTGAAAGATPGAGASSSQSRRAGWNRDEWDVTLSDGGVYRIFEDRETGRWFVEAIVD